MFRSAQAALAVILICFGIMQIPGQPQYAPLPSSVATQPETILPVPDSDEIWAAIEKLEGRVDALESARKVAASVPAVSCPNGQCPNGQCPVVTTTVQRIVPSVSVTRSSYSPRWHNNDGKSLRDHMIQDHGYDPSLSTAQMAAQHDAYHDRYGPAPPRATASYAAQYQPAMRSRSVQYSAGVSNCPGGVCPTSRSVQVQSSGGVFGFGVVGRRR